MPFDVVWRDHRHAARVLRRSPAFAATTVLTLALAIGACTAVFSLADALIFTPPPYAEPDRLAFIEAQVRSPRGSGAQLGHDAATWEAIRDSARSLDVAVYSGMVTGVNLVVGGRAAFVDQRRVGAGYFRVLGAHPELGREFAVEEDVPAGPAIAVLSHGLWTRELGGRPDIVGQPISLRGEAHLVVGVMPASFDPDGGVGVWTPLRASRRGEGGGTNFQIIGRLDRGATWDQANAELGALGMEPLRARGVRGDDGTTAWLETRSMQEVLADASLAPIVMLGAAAASVLVIACINIAALILSRGAGRVREVATRLALGASRAAVVRRLMAESLIIGIAGSAAGVVVARLGLAGLQQLASSTYGQWQAAQVDFRVLGVSAGLGVVASLLFGLLPALQASRLDVRVSLAGDGSRSVASGARAWPRRLLVMAEVAASVALLVLTALLVRTVANLGGVDPGFDSDRLVTASVSLQDARYQTEADVVRLVDESLTELRRGPGIDAAAVSLQLPYTRLLNWGFHLPDDPDRSDTIVNVVYVSDGFFETFRIPVREGRAIGRVDRPGSPPVVVVNETFARVFGREDRPMLGRPLVLSGHQPVREVVGIAGDVQQTDSGFQFAGRVSGPVMTTPTLYLPATQLPASFFNTVHTWFRPVWTVRPRPGAQATGAVARAVARVDPMLPVSPETTIENVMAAATADERLLATLVGILGAVALLLALLGIHGLVAQGVADRTRELAVRIALGATPRRAVARAAASGVMLAGFGAAVGGLLSVWAVGLVQSFLWGVEARDPATIAAASLFFVAIAGAASVLPALRILRLDPAEALRWRR